MEKFVQGRSVASHPRSQYLLYDVTSGKVIGLYYNRSLAIDSLKQHTLHSKVKSVLELVHVDLAITFDIELPF